MTSFGLLLCVWKTVTPCDFVWSSVPRGSEFTERSLPRRLSIMHFARSVNWRQRRCYSLLQFLSIYAREMFIEWPETNKQTHTRTVQTEHRSCGGADRKHNVQDLARTSRISSRGPNARFINTAIRWKYFVGA